MASLLQLAQLAAAGCQHLEHRVCLSMGHNHLEDLVMILLLVMAAVYWMGQATRV